MEIKLRIEYKDSQAITTLNFNEYDPISHFSITLYNLNILQFNNIDYLFNFSKEQKKELKNNNYIILENYNINIKKINECLVFRLYVNENRFIKLFKIYFKENKFLVRTHEISRYSHFLNNNFDTVEDCYNFLNERYNIKLNKKRLENLISNYMVNKFIGE